MQLDFDLADIPVEFLPFFEPEGPGVVEVAMSPVSLFSPSCREEQRRVVVAAGSRPGFPIH